MEGGTSGSEERREVETAGTARRRETLKKKKSRKPLMIFNFLEELGWFGFIYNFKQTLKNVKVRAKVNYFFFSFVFFLKFKESKQKT